MTDKIIVYTTCSNPQEAEKVAARLLEKKLAACVSFTPGATSVYRWKGVVEQSVEVTITIKSRRDLLEKLMVELRKVHPYEIPEILAVPVVAGWPPYLDWMDAELPAQPIGSEG